jgi:hypothetical protein
MAHAHDAGSTAGTPSNACFGSEPSRCERSWASKLRKWRSVREVIYSPAPQASRSTILTLSGTLSMSLFCFLESLSGVPFVRWASSRHARCGRGTFFRLLL